MKRQSQASKPLHSLRSLALQLPETEEGIACAGTALERRTIKVRKKAFTFIGSSDLMLKLDQSLAEATRLASANPNITVGAHGWVTVKFGAGESPPLSCLSTWLEESYRLFAPGQQDATSAAGTSPVKKTPKATKLKTSRRSK
jgi:YjbR protein